MELGPLLKQPVLDLEHTPDTEGPICSIWSPHQAYVDLIENRFPLADSHITQHLGRANYERYVRCRAKKNAPTDGNDQKSSPAMEFPVPDPSVTVGASSFHDSGVGTSVPTLGSYAETLMSYRHEDRCVRIPPLPEEAKEGKPFQCIVCGYSLRISNNKAWKYE